MMKARILILDPQRGQFRGSTSLDPVDELGPAFTQSARGWFVGCLVGRSGIVV